MVKEKTAPKKASGFKKPSAISKELAAVVGEGPMPRTEITQKLWDYIKKHDLQDSKDRRQINADDKLKKIFGGKHSVSMFEMTKLVSAHIVS